MILNSIDIEQHIARNAVVYYCWFDSECIHERTWLYNVLNIFDLPREFCVLSISNRNLWLSRHPKKNMIFSHFNIPPKRHQNSNFVLFELGRKWLVCGLLNKLRVSHDELQKLKRKTYFGNAHRNLMTSRAIYSCHVL